MKLLFVFFDIELTICYHYFVQNDFNKNNLNKNRLEEKAWKSLLAE